MVKYLESHGFSFCGELPKRFRTYPNIGPRIEVIGNIYENPELLK
jgi:hypothetical protein